MSPSDPLPEFGLSWRMREHEARLLADSLRNSRLTLLYAGAGASRSELLAHGVVPLLGRREADLRIAGGRGESRVVTPFIDRRDVEEPEGETELRAERVVYFSDWGSDPLPALLATVRAAMPGETPPPMPAERLADVLEAISERLGARLLIVLDAFEAFWTTCSDTPEADRFVVAFGEAVDRPRLRVNFLLAVDDRWEGRLGALRRAVRGFDDSTVRLLGFERAGPATAPPVEPPRTASKTTAASVSVVSAAPSDSPTPAKPPTLSDVIVPTALPIFAEPTASLASPPRPRRMKPPKTPVAPPVPIKTDGVYAFIESTLTQTSDASEPWHDVDSLPPPAVSRRPGAPGESSSAPAAIRQRALPPGVEPPSPIDEWLDAAIAWCRQLLKSR